jgi:hypothetical protein
MIYVAGGLVVVIGFFYRVLDGLAIDPHPDHR